MDPTSPLPSDPGKLNALVRQALSDGNLAFLDATDGRRDIWNMRSPGAQLSKLQLAPGIVRKNVRQVLAFLLAQGLDPMEKDSKGLSLFHHVFKGIRHTREDWIAGLLEAGVPTGLSNDDGQTALSMAIVARNTAVAQQLIDFGVTPSEADRRALKKADCRDGLVLFWNTFGTQMDQDGLNQALLDACSDGLTQKVEALLDLGAEPVLTNSMGWNALTLLGKRSTLEARVVERLVSLGVDPGQPGQDIFGKETTFNSQILNWAEVSGKKRRKKWRKMESVVAEGRQTRLEQILDAPAEPPVRKARM